MDFRNAVIASLDKLIESGKVEQMLEKVLEKTIGDVLQEQLRSYSDFGKQITDLVHKSLGLQGELDLPSYNDIILKIVRMQLATRTDAVIQQQVSEHLSQLLTPPPESITLSALIEKYIERLKEYEESGCVCHGEREITLITSVDGSFTHVGLDDAPKKKRHDCDIQFGVYKDSIYHLRFQNQEVEKQLFAGPFSGFEQMLFQMKAAGTKLIMEPVDDIETTYAVGHDD